MRNPANDRASVEAANLSPYPSGEGLGWGLSDGPDARRDSPTPNPSPEGEGLDPASNTRRCILTGERADPATLIRLALSPDGAVLPDVRGKAPGRGAWIGVDRPALETAIAKGKLKAALSRAFKTGDITIPADLPARVESALERAALDRLGLEARGGTIITGGERIERAAREGKLHLLLHAADAGADGSRKLDQAWRVGRETTGSGEVGLHIAAPRTILSLALGRENVVHLGVGDRGAADRVRTALDRWHRFTGFNSSGQPCERAPQGPTPPFGAPDPVSGTPGLS